MLTKAQAGGNMSANKLSREQPGGWKEGVGRVFEPPEAPHTDRSKATSNIHGNGLTICHSSLQEKINK